MSGKNIDELDVVTSLESNDKMYLGRSPYGSTDDKAWNMAALLATLYGEPQVVASDSAVTLTNPIKSLILVTINAPDEPLTLPAMNAADSYPESKPLVIVNFSAYDLPICKSGNTGTPDYTIRSNGFLELKCINNSSAGGQFFVESLSVSDISGLQSALNTKVDINNLAFVTAGQTLTMADHNGKFLLIDSATNGTVTLPTGAGLGGFNFEYFISNNGAITFAIQGSDYLEGVKVARRADSGKIFIKSTSGINYFCAQASKPLADAVVIINSSTTLDESHVGKLLIYNSATAITVTLPLSTSLDTATHSFIGAYNFSGINIGLGKVTLAKQGSDTLRNNVELDRYAVHSVSLFSSEYYVAGGTSVQAVSFALGPFNPTSGRTYDFSSNLPELYTFTAIDYMNDSGTATINAQINGTNITGGASLSLSNTLQTATLTAANANAVGNKLQLNVSAASSCVNLRAIVRGTVRR